MSHWRVTAVILAACVAIQRASYLSIDERLASLRAINAVLIASYGRVAIGPRTVRQDKMTRWREKLLNFQSVKTVPLVRYRWETAAPASGACLLKPHSIKCSRTDDNNTARPPQMRLRLGSAPWRPRPAPQPSGFLRSPSYHIKQISKM